MAISAYSSTPASNTSISGINIAEGCLPSGINDAIRQLMADIASQGLARFQTRAADLPSAATLNLDGSVGEYVNVTGTTGITAITLADGKWYATKFSAALTITNGASLICPGGVNYTAAAGDVLIWAGEASGVVRCIGGIKGNGQPLVSSLDGVVIGSTTPAAGSFTSINGGQLAGFRNAIVNGAMGISQQNGTSSVALTTSVAYGSCDRWAAAQGGTAAGTVAQVIGNSPSGLRYCVRIGRNAAATSTNIIQLQQALTTDNSVRFAGSAATLSFWAKSGANYSGGNLTANVYSGTGTDQSAANLAGGWTGTTTPITSAQSITTTWTRYSFTGTIPANCTQLGVYIAYTPSGTAGADDNIYITGVQLEIGSVATPFENAPDLDIQRCLRHAESGTVCAVSYNSTGSAIQRSMIYFKAKKFISPTMSFAYVSGTSQTPTVAANAIDGCWVAWPSFTAAGQETVCTYFARSEL